MLTIEEIKKELDAGNTVELECVDRDKLIIEFPDCEEYALKPFTVTKIDRHDLIHTKRSIYRIHKNIIRYFKIKLPTQTLNNLIDVAVQAWKDKAISSQLTIMSDSVHFFDSNRSAVSFTDKSIAKGIDYIKSLYTETFVIENNACVLKIRKEARIDFANSYSGYAVSDGIEGVPFNYIQANMDGTDKAWDIPHRLLKGATVTQKRGAV